MRPCCILLAIFFTAVAAARAQDASATAASAGPLVSGTLRYDLRYSQTTQFGSGADNQQWSYVSGDASYANTSKRHPFSLQYGGGYGQEWVGPSSGGNVFQHLNLSQGIAGRRWNLTASDNAIYSFETPTIGFSGVPGTGEPVGGSGSTTPPDQTILTQNTRLFNNITTVGFKEKLNNAITFNMDGTTGQMRYIDDTALNMDTLMAEAGVTLRLNARTSVSGQYSFSRYSYGSTDYSLQTQMLQFSFIRRWSKRFTTTAAAGPQWIASAGTPSAGALAVPNSTMLSLSAMANYQLRRGTASVSYFRGTTGGSGFTLGSKIESVNGNFSRELGKNLTVGLTGAYIRTTALSSAEFEYACTIDNQTYLCLAPLNLTPVTDAIYGGAQATRKLGRNFNLFANYTAISQSVNYTITVPNTPISSSVNILSGLYQVIGFGIGYSPRELRFKK